jgi:glycogen debranching enzyme
LEEKIEARSLHLAYEGRDGVIRRTHVECSPQPQKVSSSLMDFAFPLQPKEEATVVLTIACESTGRVRSSRSYEHAFHEAKERSEASKANDCLIETSNTQFNEWLECSYQDIRMMVTETPEGPYPYAGLPWFSAPFGRDGIITALEYLWVNPDIAKGVLAYLASTQATQVVPEQDAEPGKILHESRKGEMAALGEEWMDTWGDRDGDGFVEYARRSANGFIHQGWKDSFNAVFHADGRPQRDPLPCVKCRAMSMRRSSGRPHSPPYWDNLKWPLVSHSRPGC